MGHSCKEKDDLKEGTAPGRLHLAFDCADPLAVAEKLVMAGAELRGESVQGRALVQAWAAGMRLWERRGVLVMAGGGE